MKAIQLLLLSSCSSVCLWNGVQHSEDKLTIVGITILMVLIIEFFNRYKEQKRIRKQYPFLNTKETSDFEWIERKDKTQKL